jgi:hypothetical protein
MARADFLARKIPPFFGAACSSFKMLYLSAKYVIYRESSAMEFTSMARFTPPIRLALFVFGLAAGSLFVNAAAFAEQNCGEDLKRLSQKREVELTRINGLVAAAKGKPLDPAMFCSQSAGLNAAENALIAYMEKNKDWCSVPDDALAAMKTNHAKSAAFAAKACTVAAQMKKQQAAGAASNAPQAPALPAGPL